MKKIAIDCTHLVRGEVGGFEALLENLLEGFSEVCPGNVSISLYVRRDQGDFFTRFAGAFTIRPVSLANRIQRILWQQAVVPFLGLAYDAFLFPGNVRPFVTFRHSVTTVNDIQFTKHPELWPWYILLHHRTNIAYAAKRSKVLVTLSHAMADEICQYYGRDHVEVIYPPTVIREVAAGERNAATDDLPFREPFLLVPSSMKPHKNIPNLVAALRELETEGVDLPDFVFIGAFTEDLFPGRGANIHVLGYVDASLRDELFRRCSAVVMPSIYEGFGMPYVESKLVRKPMVASDIAVAREILGDAASYVPSPHGPKEIRQAILAFLADPPAPPSLEGAEELLARTRPAAAAQRYLDLLLPA